MHDEDYAREPAFWAVLPAFVRYDKTLCPNAKLLYAELSALAEKDGYAWPTNRYLCEVFGLKERAIRNLISQLSDAKYIKVEVEKDKRKCVEKRKIWILPPANICPTPGKKMPHPSGKNLPPIYNEEQYKYRTIACDGTIDDTAAAKKSENLPKWKSERFAGFWNFYPRKEAKKKAAAAWDKLRPDDALIAQMGAALRRAKASDDWKRGIGIPYASTWLNGQRWEDELAAPQPVQDGGWADDPEVI